MNKTNLGKVVGDSAFEDWQKRNPGKNWEEFMKDIQGPGVLGFRYKESTETGSLIYDVILEGDIVSGTIEIPPGATGADFITLEFVRFDGEGNSIVKSKNSKGQYGDEIIIKRGKRGYTGGVIGEPQPPGSVPYGTIVEWVGNLPEGWLYTNGAILDKKKYPHMSFLPGITQPVNPKFQLSASTQYIKNGMVDGYTKYLFKGFEGITCEVWDNSGGSNSTYCTDFISLIHNSGRISRGPYGPIKYGMKKGVIFNLTLNEIMNISYLKMNRKNAEGTYTENSLGNHSSLTPVVDWYLVIEYMNDEGLWIKGVEIHNKTDFIPLNETTSAFMVKSPFKSNKYRIYLDTNKTTFNWNDTVCPICFIGELEIGFNKGGAQYNDYIQLPNEKDNQGRYKIIYVGQPLEIQEPTMYSYSKDNTFNGEVPLSLAVNNKLPNYIQGITMSEPQPLRIGYTNKYYNDSDTWILMRTHEDKEGYYYNEKGDLKYIPKPYNWSKWDFENHEWVDDIDLKERIKSELLDRYVSLEVKKEKMIDLKIDISKIENEILSIKNELDEIKDSF